MPCQDATAFVARLREDIQFRRRVLETAGPEDLSHLLQANGFAFDQRELVGAMAACMAQAEKADR